VADPGEALRALPSIDRLLQEPATAGLLALYPRAAVVETLRGVVDTLRARLRTGEDAPTERLVEDAERILQRRFQPRLRRVVNATGVVLHTNLGRAPLCNPALDAVAMASGYVNLEFDLESGQRGHRSDHVEDLLKELTGAEAACVVNNNAASVLLLLDELARGREVIVARSELIEIGGAFRLPDVLERSGATLVEVGATNKCYARDYERAITENTALLLKTHPSNFRIVGFTHEVTLEELAELGRRKNLPTAMDLGSGVFVELARWGLPAEPTVSRCVSSGVDLVCFSGDKLMGGPQAGILVGRREIIARLARNPLMRAFRCDKMTLAALQATLSVYRYPERLPRGIPALEMLTRAAEALEAPARALAERLRAVLDAQTRVEACPGMSLPGGGSLPATEIPTWMVRITPAGHWAERLRQAEYPVIARTEEDAFILDVRTLLEGDEERIVAGFVSSSPSPASPRAVD